MMKKMIVAAILCGMLVFSNVASAESLPLYTYRAEVTRVVDGDTMDMTIDMGLGIVLRDRVRVLDFDAAETWRPKNEAERKHGEAATKRATELLSAPVTVVVDGRGSFGRVLARIVLEDGRDFAEVMKSEGFQKRPHY